MHTFFRRGDIAATAIIQHQTQKIRCAYTADVVRSTLPVHVKAVRSLWGRIGLTFLLDAAVAGIVIINHIGVLVMTLFAFIVDVVRSTLPVDVRAVQSDRIATINLFFKYSRSHVCQGQDLRLG